MTVEDWLGKDNKLGIDIWNKKYRFNNESFEEWLKRVSNNDKEVEKLIREKKFLFGGRTLTNRGTGKEASYSNCYSVGEVDDSLEDIMNVNTQLAMTYKAQGGQGLSLSNLRPAGCGINKGQFESDGIIPFMEIFNETTKGISQGGSRKGALLMTLDAWHKEAEKFIKIKSKKGKIEKANLSLEIDNKFMKCVKKYYETGEIITKHIEREYEGNKVEYDVTPIDLYKLMIKTAYDWGEPGCIFTDRFYNYNLMEKVPDYIIEGANPCGEQPLPKHGACNLGSINLSAFVKEPFTREAFLDRKELLNTVQVAVKALNTVLEENINNHPLLEQKNMAEKYQNIGLGIMGMHDMLIKLNIVYGSKKSISFLDDLMNDIFQTAFATSSQLAKETEEFPCYDERIFDSEIFINHFVSESLIEELKKKKLKNCSLLSIAPTGSIATMLNISTGIEPIYEVSYQRKTEGMSNGKEKLYEVFTGVAKEYKEIFQNNLPDTFITASQIDWKKRIDIQSVIQKHVDTGISSTINLPKDISFEEIEKLYLYAWEKGLKGITIFREGCKREAVLNKDKNIENKPNFQYNSIKPITREELKLKSLDGRSYVKRTACGKLNIHINHTPNDEMIEVFVNSSKSGGCSANANCIGRYASTALRSGIRIEDIIDTTKGIKCSACANARGKGEDLDGISCGDAIAKSIEEEYQRLRKNKEILEDADNAIKEHEKILDLINKPSLIGCPECGSHLAFEGGCMICKNCGWSKCD